MEGFHNSYDPGYRSPFGAAKTGEKVYLRLDVKNPVSGLSCYVRTWHDEKGAKLFKMECEKWGDEAVYSAELTMPEDPCLIWYSFVLETFDGRSFYGNNEKFRGGRGRMYSSNPEGYQITVYNEAKTPSWYKEGVAYQIFPDSFNRGADWLERAAADAVPGRKGPRKVIQMDWDDKPFYIRNESGAIERWTGYGGTLSGIKDKLPYLNDLGITIIYLNPVFEAASSHRYDTADFMKIDPGLGDEKSFKALVDEAKKYGIKIILDGVFNHVGRDSIYFNAFGNYGEGGAAQDKNSPYYKWFSFENWPDKYDCWWGVTDLPNVNENDPSYKEYICTGEDSVIRHWMRLGIGGFRLDVADELPDEFIEDIRRVIKEEDEDGVLLGEVWEDASNKISYGKRRRYFLGNELDSVMNYPFREGGLNFMKGSITAGELVSRIMNQMENYPPENFYGNLNLIGSHDRERALTFLGDAPDKNSLSDRDKEKFELDPQQRAIAKKRLKALALIQFTLPGLPCIYYGDEAGMEGYTDPYNRGPYPWGREDEELISYYKKIITIRKENEAFVKGSYIPVSYGDNVYGCMREYEGEKICVLVNRSTWETENIDIPSDAPEAVDLLVGNTFETNVDKLHINLAPLSGIVLKFIQF